MHNSFIITLENGLAPVLLHRGASDEREGPSKYRTQDTRNETHAKDRNKEMMDEYEVYKQKCKAIREANAALREDIKTGLPEWLATLRRYDDPDVDAEDVWQ